MNNAEEKNTSHMIFYGEKDIDYTKSSNYAFLNWNFDNSLGGKDNVSQLIQDNFVMGNAYMGNAVLSLYSILCSIVQRQMFLFFQLCLIFGME